MIDPALMQLMMPTGLTTAVLNYAKPSDGAPTQQGFNLAANTMPVGQIAAPQIGNVGTNNAAPIDTTAFNPNSNQMAVGQVVAPTIGDLSSTGSGKKNVFSTGNILKALIGSNFGQ